jgi:DNA ligase-1
MRDFAELLDRLSFEPARNGKLRLLTDYLRRTPDPERGYAFAALTGALSFAQAKPGLIRRLVAERVDPVLFALSYDYVGDLSETAALIWPRSDKAPYPQNGAPLALTQVVEILTHGGKLDLPGHFAGWLDNLDETGRWALLKLITGALRVGVSARLAKTAAAALGGRDVEEIEQLWHGLSPPYLELFVWLEGQGPRPEGTNPAPFRPVMLAHPLDEADLPNLDAKSFSAEWKWDGVRVQAVLGRDDERPLIKLYSRAGEDMTLAFPDIVEALLPIKARSFALDGELLIRRDGALQTFGVLQQRLNRKAVTPKLLHDFPAHIRAYDLLEWDGEDLRNLPFDARREKLARFIASAHCEKIDQSEPIIFADWESLRASRKNPSGADAPVVEGVMLKRREALYVAGRPRGEWWKWKRDPYNIDAVLMYAQRGHGKRSSLYSDYTFGVWRDGVEGRALTPVGKAYSGFTDQELARLDKFVRENTTNRFGPVREVAHGPNVGLVLEVAFEGLNRSTRHRSGLAMRFPRIARIRWDKPAAEADEIGALELLLRDSE